MNQKTLELLKKIQDSGIDICLISKYWTDAQLMNYYDLGFRKFGENRIKILIEKTKKFPEDIEWHFIGNIQSKNLKKICEYSDVIQSFDRLDLLEKLTKLDDVEILLQINLTEGNDINGIKISELEMAIGKINNLGINCNGFMFHPPIEISDAEKIKIFKKMNKIFSKYPNYKTLSMGTSSDYKLANVCGATLNRLGRVLKN